MNQPITRAEWELSGATSDTVEEIKDIFGDLWSGDCRSAGLRDLRKLRRQLTAQLAAMDEVIDRMTADQPKLEVVASNEHAPFTVLHGTGDVIRSNEPDPFNRAVSDVFSNRPFGGDGPEAA
ncbi:hypothetical protein [Euryhalocaulis caribicus]|uniref:hypothetical protein n=1 Tax=Euryhalocaulis caribicus TaxID=1161401 RepID=UPI0003AAFCD4|nr:hypothetical protein [Euryhalocaulis caribicus]